MDKELYFHRCFVRTNHLPRILRLEPLVKTNAVFLFVEQAIEHVFAFHNITGWIPPATVDVLKASIPDQIYFHPSIGLALNHQCAIDEAMRYAEEEGFVLDSWLYLPHYLARGQLEFYLEVVRSKTRPVNLSFINMLAFAGLLSRLVMQDNRIDSVVLIIWRVVHVFMRRFPLEWIYYDARQWSMAYSVRHFEIHIQLIEEDPFQESKPEYSQFAGP